jgi:hypothetical protein
MSHQIVTNSQLGEREKVELSPAYRGGGEAAGRGEGGLDFSKEGLSQISDCWCRSVNCHWMAGSDVPVEHLTIR